MFYLHDNLDNRALRDATSSSNLRARRSHRAPSLTPARLASWNTSEDEYFNSSVRRLLRQEVNDGDTDVNIDGDSGRGAEDGLEMAPRRRRPRVTEYIPRRRNHGEPRALVEGVDYDDLTDLHEPDLRVRDHPPARRRQNCCMRVSKTHSLKIGRAFSLMRNL
ncbi:hypothetical protein E4U61_007865 [Claviceps capensis]|nr:hypothetical protein E4U61_007865 [Claviceps capensis]